MPGPAVGCNTPKSAGRPWQCLRAGDGSQWGGREGVASNSFFLSSLQRERKLPAALLGRRFPPAQYCLPSSQAERGGRCCPQQGPQPRRSRIPGSPSLDLPETRGEGLRRGSPQGSKDGRRRKGSRSGRRGGREAQDPARCPPEHGAAPSLPGWEEGGGSASPTAGWG